MRLPTTTLSLLAIAPAAAAAEERTYTDDLGVVHTTTKEKPTIVTFAHTAVSAFDYGELWTFAVSLGVGAGRQKKISHADRVGRRQTTRNQRRNNE